VAACQLALGASGLDLRVNPAGADPCTLRIKARAARLRLHPGSPVGKSRRLCYKARAMAA